MTTSHPKKAAPVVGAFVITAAALSVALVHDIPGPGSAGLGLAERALDIPFVLQATHSVSMKNLQFNPNMVDMAVGDTVVWTNNETDGTIHNITSDDGSSFVSPDVPPGETFSYTASSPGTFPYHCRIHPQTTGTLHVSGAAADQPPPPDDPPPPPDDPPPPADPPPDPGPGLPGLPELPSLPGLPGLPGLVGLPGSELSAALFVSVWQVFADRAHRER